MAIYSFDEMREHSGHEIEVAVYGEPDDPINVTIECMSCHRILVSLDPSQRDDAQLATEVASLRKALTDLIETLDYAHNNVKPRGMVGRFLFGRQSETSEHAIISVARAALKQDRPT